MPRRDAQGRMIRPASPTPPEWDSATVESMVAWASFYLNRAAELAGYCMTDHLRDEGVIRDCHDIIGAVSAVRDVLQLLETRPDARVVDIPAPTDHAGTST